MRQGQRGPITLDGKAGGNEYTHADDTHNMASGPIYFGSDNSNHVPEAFHGRWTLVALAFDRYNHGTQIGRADFIVIDW